MLRKGRRNPRTRHHGYGATTRRLQQLLAETRQKRLVAGNPIYDRAQELFAAGRPVIVDPGSFVYTASEEWRNRFRSTRWHNTVAVDGEEISPFAEGAYFALGADPEPAVVEWDTSDVSDTLVAEHRGYLRLEDPVTHRRTFRFDKTDGTFAIEDRLGGAAQHAIELKRVIESQ